jgi:outer membrane protein assembly factor BamB
VYALNAATGAQLWSFTTGGFVNSSPAVANGVLYAGSNDSNLYAVNAATGAQLWRFTTGNAVEASPVVANGVVYAGSDDGNLYAFDLAGGTAAVKPPAPAQLHPNYALRSQHRKPA